MWTLRAGFTRKFACGLRSWAAAPAMTRRAVHMRRGQHEWDRNTHENATAELSL